MPTAPLTYEDAIRQFIYPSDFREEALRIFPDRKKLHTAIEQNQDVGRLLRDMRPDDPANEQAAKDLYDQWKRLWPNQYNFLPAAIPAKAQPPATAVHTRKLAS